MRSPDKVNQSGVIDLSLSNYDLVYCTRKTSLPKSHIHNYIFVCSMKSYSNKIYLESLNFIAPVKRIRVKANSNSWFDIQIMSATQRREKLYKKLYKYASLKTDKDNFIC